jgi:endonuclease YncB( thermonuclease family)
MRALRSRSAALFVLAAFGCASSSSSADEAGSSPAGSGATAGGASSKPTPATTGGEPAEGPAAAILLNGQRVTVTWSDGDSFRFTSGLYKGNGVRITRYNSLESYGPVHRWGSWTARELYDIAKSAKDVGSKQVWNCTTDGGKDHYDRVLVDCPDLAAEMLRQGIGHLFVMEGDADAALLQLQREAQDGKRGIWAKGVPSRIVTSVHSATEGKGYLRLVDARTGRSTVEDSTFVYEICQEVCSGNPDEQSCLVYVPFEQRYRNKPDCLK